MGNGLKDLAGLTQRIRAGSSVAYLIAIGFTAIATVVQASLALSVDGVVPFAAFFPATLFSTVLGGVGPGVLSATLGGLLGWWAFLPPHMRFFPLTAGQEISIVLYAFTVLCLVWIGNHYRRVVTKLRGEEKLRKLAVDELAHRLKNKVATIQSVIAIRLRGQPDVQTEVMGCLQALSAADDLLLASQGNGAQLRDIIMAEVSPYKAEGRSKLVGPEVVLPPRLALVMALLLHELATNAAKYGAFSISEGKVSIHWSIDRGHLEFLWRESGGPTVTPPTRRGFGTRLFMRALEPFGGTADAEFLPTGLMCSLLLPLTEFSPGVVPEAATAALREVTPERTPSEARAAVNVR
jgi:two-component sensor histidine kinase